ncbi:EAL domain-containing protein [Bordetella holmesii]|uniref:EAL domain-containing protein n=1 Tax=Bordetella holmesii TaxID=35814 RepID=UPI00129872E8|nr:EAL domain-containing protein [Bordetella holmesii]QGD28881.1 EAL domain-containing protein [Bordetella holmesii]
MRLSLHLLLSIVLLMGLLLFGVLLTSLWSATRDAEAYQASRAREAASSLAWAIGRFDGDSQNWLTRLPAANAEGPRLRIDEASLGRSIPLWPASAEPPPDLAVLARSPYQSADGASEGHVVAYAAPSDAAPAAYLAGMAAQALLFVLATLGWCLYVRHLMRWMRQGPLQSLARAAHGQDDGQSAELSDLLPVREALANNRREQEHVVARLQQRIAMLENEATREAVTRLPNRKTFFERFREILRGQATLASGHVLIFRQRDMAEINRRMHHEATDQWLRLSATQLQQTIREHAGPQAMLARLNGSDFVALLPGLAAQPALALSERVRRELRLRRLPLRQHEWCRWAIALGRYEAGEEVGAVMARLDNALMCAETANDDVLQMAEFAGERRMDGEYRWQDLITQALDEHRFYLEVHPRSDSAGHLLHEEARMMLRGTDALPASVFMPAASRLGLAADCDIQAIRLALDTRSRQAGPLALPLAQASLAQPNFLARLKSLLDDRPAQSRHLILEIDAHSVVDYYDTVRSLCEICATLGTRIGVQRLNEQLSAIEKLHQLPLVYLKIGGGFVRSLASSPGNRQLASTIVRTAIALNIPAYACDAQDESQTALLCSLGFIVLKRLTNEDAPLDEAISHAGLHLEPIAAPEPSLLMKRQEHSEKRLSEMAGALQSHRQLQALLSHELRTPAATISAAAQSLETILAGSGQEVDSRLARIRRAVGRMIDIIDQMLSPERRDDQVMAPRLEIVDLGELAHNVCASMQADSAHPLIVRNNTPAAARCDPLLTALVLRNLVQNAIKYSPADQPVVIDAGVATAQDQQAMAWLAVSDNGPGLDEAEIDAIFEPHFRSTAHRETPGVGLGLHLAREICISQEGNLTAQARPGLGTRFLIALPASGQADQPAPAELL